jgi:hypothetical protein
MIKLATAGAMAALFLTACATPLPNSPSVLVLPGTGKNFDQFRADDGQCRQYAYGAIGGDQEYDSQYAAQRRYDVAFTQCMYAKGHRVPVAGHYSNPRQASRASNIPPPPPGLPPPEAPPDYRRN